MSVPPPESTVDPLKDSGSETYAAIDENPFHLVKQDPLSTFS